MMVARGQFSGHGGIIRKELLQHSFTVRYYKYIKTYFHQMKEIQNNRSSWKGLDIKNEGWQSFVKVLAN